ncbi:MAG: InlB B-repeat-containing protein, partial [Clostridia bacterium]|nr:InlB B-repeat-containing protein [Clostridia bacterium]
ANSYTITFNYGEGSGTETTRGVTYGSTVTDLPVATAPAGKTFTAWKMENGSVFANGTAYNFENNITLTANYTTDEYIITYRLDGGNPLPADAITSYSISTQDITLPTATKTGHTFTGWNNGTQVITSIAAGTTGSLDLTATWQAKSYTITFNYNGGTGSETTRDVTYGSTVTDLPTVTPPTGHVFLGWKKEDNSVFNNGDQYLFDRNMTLTAYFGEKFTVTINNTTAASFTAWADNTQDNTLYVSYGDTLTIPKIKWDNFSETRKNNEDYYFKGWFYRDKNNVERQFDPNVAFTLENLNVNTYNITIYAKVEAQWAGPF